MRIDTLVLLAAPAEARRRAENNVRSRPDAEAFFARGTARGYIAIHHYRCGRWLPAVHSVETLRASGDDAGREQTVP